MGARRFEPAAAAPAPEPENPARELLGILARGKWTVLLVFLVVTAGATWATLRLPPTFEAEASLMVRIGREYVYRPEVGRTESARTPSLSEMVNSEVEILSSRDLAEQVVRELGVRALYPEVLELEPDEEIATEKAVLRFRKAASIRPVLESSVIKVGFEHEVPRLAADAVNRLVEHFKDKHIEVFGEERSERIEGRLEASRAALAQAEQALATFKRENAVFDLDEQRKNLLARRERLAAEEAQTSEALTEARFLVTPEDHEEVPAAGELPPHLRPEMKSELLRHRYELERSLWSLEPESGDRLVEEAQLRLLELELEEGELLRDFAPTNRRVQTVQAEIARVRTFLDEAQRQAGAFDTARRSERATRAQELRAEIARVTGDLELLVREERRLERLEARRNLQVLESRRSDQIGRIEEVDALLRDLDEEEQELRRLERELTSAEGAAQTYKDRYEEARITEELDRERRISVRVIENAAAPVAPTGLPRNLKLALGAVVGLVSGIGVAVLLDLFRTR